VTVDDETIRANSELRQCPDCGGLARPNILIFGDSQWLSEQCEHQERRYADCLTRITGSKLLIVEFGAGLAVPTVRWECEHHDGQSVRVNPRDWQGPSGTISVPLGALEAIRRIDAAL
jgi:NAD-dependent SIR2 family protein deacetylase